MKKNGRVKTLNRGKNEKLPKNSLKEVETSGKL